MGNHHKTKTMNKSLQLQAKLLEVGFKYLRLCDTESSTSPDIKHYTLENELGADTDFCTINEYIDLSSEKGLRIIDCFLNPSLIHPNPLDI
jgi:hypothetical protein